MWFLFCNRSRILTIKDADPDNGYDFWTMIRLLEAFLNGEIQCRDDEIFDI